MHGFGNVAHVIFIWHSCIGFLVLYAEAAAEIEVCQRFAELCMDFVIELQHDLRCQHERCFVENLRADVAVQTDELYIFARDGFLYGFKRLAVFKCKAELGIDLTRADKLMRVGVNAGLDAHGNGRNDAFFRRELFNAVQLV